MPAFVPTAPLSRDPGSFRDPAGGVYHHDGRVFRYLTDRGAADFQSLEASGLLHTLIDQRVLVETTEVSVEQLPVDATSEPPALILEHERVPFISYSYEWPFELLRSAALQYLDVLRLSLDHGFVLKDATSFNTQFFGSRPVMIDVSSFEPYEAGRPWAGYAQFCRMFLNPLLLQSLVGLPYQSWLRASIEGIAPGELGALLPFRRKLRRDVLMHVVAQAWMGRRLAPDAEAVSQAAAQSISLKTLTKLIDQLERTISKLKRPGGADSNWSSYEQDCHYQTVDTAVKSRAVESVLKQVRPGTVWDLGGRAATSSRSTETSSPWVA